MSEFYVKKSFLAGLETTVTATGNNDIPNLAQVQSIVEGHIVIYDAVRAHEHDANVDTATGGLLTIDGVTLVAGDRVLLSAQTSSVDNGIYVAASGAWSRAADMDTGDTVKPYSSVYVTDGTAGAGHKMYVQATADVTVGTDAMVWVHGHTFDNDAAHIDVDDSGFTVISGTNVQDALDSADTAVGNLDTRLDDLSGVTGSDLGTFTGTTITDNNDIKCALQELETGLEGIDVSGQVQTYYDGQKYKVTGQALPQGWTTITHNLNDLHPSSIEIYDVGNNRMTDAFNIETLDVNSLRIQNETTIGLTDMIVVIRA